MVKGLIYTIDRGPNTKTTCTERLPGTSYHFLRHCAHSFGCPRRSSMGSLSSVSGCKVGACFYSGIYTTCSGKVCLGANNFARQTVFGRSVVYTKAVVRGNCSIICTTSTEMCRSRGCSKERRFREGFSLKMSRTRRPRVFRKMPSRKRKVHLMGEDLNCLVEAKRF